MEKHNKLKLPYQVDVVVDFIRPLVLRTRHGRVEVVKPVRDVYNWVSKTGVLVYNADEVDIALLLIWSKDGKRRVLDIYVSAYVDADAYKSIFDLVDLMWDYGRSYNTIEEMLVGKDINEIKKMLLAYVPPDA